MKISVLSLNKPNITDFALERNKILKKSKADWVLFLDTDEKLARKLTFDENKFDAYYIYRKNYFLGQYIGTDKIIRLAKKNAGKWERAVHEKWIIKGRIGILDNYIIHNTAGDLHSYINKINKYSTLHAIENKKEGKKATLFKIVFYPPGKFIVTFFKSKNTVFSIMQALHSFLSWSKQYFLYS